MVQNVIVPRKVKKLNLVGPEPGVTRRYVARNQLLTGLPSFRPTVMPTGLERICHSSPSLSERLQATTPVLNSNPRRCFVTAGLLGDLVLGRERFRLIFRQRQQLSSGDPVRQGVGRLQQFPRLWSHTDK